MKLVISAFVAAAALTALPASAAPVAERAAGPMPKAVVKASVTELTEGDRVSLKVRVPQAKDAKRVVLQERITNILGELEWKDVDKAPARARVEFRETVTAHNEASYRVAVSYRGRTRPVVSKSIALTVWRWIELRDFAPYFETAPYMIVNGQDTMNGDAYRTWGLHFAGTLRSWESRITPGRNCTKFHAVLGLSDRSEDGSSGSIAFTAEDAPIYQSPALVPGMTVPVDLELDRPYRFGLAAANTSPERVKAYPMVGNGAFYCTGVAG